jgi:hypothetical protein
MTPAHHRSCETQCIEPAGVHDDTSTRGCPNLANQSDSATDPTPLVPSPRRTYLHRAGFARSTAVCLGTFVVALSVDERAVNAWIGRANDTGVHARAQETLPGYGETDKRAARRAASKRTSVQAKTLLPVACNAWLGCRLRSVSVVNIQAVRCC